MLCKPQWDIAPRATRKSPNYQSVIPEFYPVRADTGWTRHALSIRLSHFVRTPKQRKTTLCYGSHVDTWLTHSGYVNNSIKRATSIGNFPLKKCKVNCGYAPSRHRTQRRIIGWSKSKNAGTLAGRYSGNVYLPQRLHKLHRNHFWCNILYQSQDLVSLRDIPPAL